MSLRCYFVVALVIVTSALAQTSAPVSSKFPVTIHVTSVRMEKSQDIRTDYNGKISGDDYIWSVMVCEIGEKTYGLKGHRLSTGWYAGRQTKRGFEIQFKENDKEKTRTYRIVEEH